MPLPAYIDADDDTKAIWRYLQKAVVISWHSYSLGRARQQLEIEGSEARSVGELRKAMSTAGPTFGQYSDDLVLDGLLKVLRHVARITILFAGPPQVSMNAEAHKPTSCDRSLGIITRPNLPSAPAVGCADSSTAASGGRHPKRASDAVHGQPACPNEQQLSTLLYAVAQPRCGSGPPLPHPGRGAKR